MINIRYKTGYILHNERNGSATVRIRVTMPGMRKIDYAIGRSIPSYAPQTALKDKELGKQRNGIGVFCIGF